MCNCASVYIDHINHVDCVNNTIICSVCINASVLYIISDMFHLAIIYLEPFTLYKRMV